MRRKKKGEIRLSDPDIAISAGMIMTYYSWQAECVEKGWDETTPLDLSSSIYGASSFATQVFGTDVTHIQVKDVFSDKNISLTGMTYDKSADQVSRTLEPNPELLAFLSKNIFTSLSKNVDQGTKNLAKKAMDRLNLDLKRISGQLD